MFFLVAHKINDIFTTGCVAASIQDVSPWHPPLSIHSLVYPSNIVQECAISPIEYDRNQSMSSKMRLDRTPLFCLGFPHIVHFGLWGKLAAVSWTMLWIAHMARNRGILLTASEELKLLINNPMSKPSWKQTFQPWPNIRWLQPGWRPDCHLMRDSEPERPTDSWPSGTVCNNKCLLF